MKYSAVNAKVAGMSAKLLNQDDYFMLCSNLDPESALKALKSHITYSQMTDDLTSIRSVTFPLLYSDYKKISSFINDTNMKKYLESLLLKRELHTVKQVLRANYDSGEYKGKDFAQQLKGSKIYEFIRNTYKPNTSLSELEIFLDLYYYTNLWKATNKYLTGANKAIAVKISGTEIDMYNILRIYGLKKHYKSEKAKASKELMYKYVLPINYKLAAHDIHSMIDADSSNEVLELIKATRYGVYFSNPNIDAGSAIGENLLYKAVKDASKSSRRKNPNSIATIIHYLGQKEAELRNIISIFEAVNYSFDPKEAMSQVN